eukprot:SAG31_NODE_118_length_24006_cov_8.219266_4_plen_620_part_00
MTTVAFEQFIKGLLVFGTNQIEFAHIDYERGDQHKLVEWSSILDQYDLRVSLFNPPFSTDAEKAATLALFTNMTRIDSLFKEGGGVDSLPQLSSQATELRRHHPNASIWLSPCGDDEPSLDALMAALDTDAARGWLDGIVYGPGIHISQKQLLARLPNGYALRQYPDLSHSLAAMYPQPNWHRAWALTHGRLVVNPSPKRHSAIARMNQNYSYSRAVGFGAYSEGASDDVNKCLWSALYLEPNTTTAEVILQYARHFFVADAAADVQQLLLGLEMNWNGDALVNTAVLDTLHAAQRLDKATRQNRGNWRLQAHLFRAFYDAYVQAKLQHEVRQEEQVMHAITASVYSEHASTKAAALLLEEPWSNQVAIGWKLRAFQLASAINRSLGGGGHWGGMAVLQSQDPTLGLITIDTPLCDKAFLRHALRAADGLHSVIEKKKALSAIINWTNPGADGFYDQLGSIPRSPRLSPGFGPVTDPQFLYAPLIQYDEGGAEEAPLTRDSQRIAWYSYAQAYWNATVTLNYTGLDPTIQYRVKLVYVRGGDAGKAPVRLTAIGADGAQAVVHDYFMVNKTDVYDFTVPKSTTQKGSVRLTCHGPLGTGGMGRCCQISEIWFVNAGSRP